MLMYLPFGDWSGDGHCQYDKILINAPSMERLLDAQNIIRDEFGKDIFNQMAQDYEDYHIGSIVWDALIYTEYPLDRMVSRLSQDYDFDGIESINEFLAVEPNPYINIEFIMDIFIWLLNWAGAEITNADRSLEIPTINSWSCPGFETVGYGCYD